MSLLPGCCAPLGAGRAVQQIGGPGSAISELRSHFLPTCLRKRKVQGDSSEIPTTCPKTERSLCQPIVAPGGYWVSSTCCRREGWMLPNAAAASRADSKKSGMSSVFCRPPPLKSYRQPKEVTRRLPGEAVEFERPELPRFHFLNEPPLFGTADEFGLVVKTLWKLEALSNNSGLVCDRFCSPEWTAHCERVRKDSVFDLRPRDRCSNRQVRTRTGRVGLELYGTIQCTPSKELKLAIPESNDPAIAAIATAVRGKSTLVIEARKIAAGGRATTK